jgi:hypothetical protein
MSTTVHEESKVTLLDGTEISLRPLKISLLRPFLKKFEKVADVVEDNDKSMSLLVECVLIAMQQYSPEHAKDVKILEDLLDLPTVYKIIEAASGIDLGNANALLANISNN